MNQATAAYGFRKVVQLKFDDAVTAVKEAMKEQGFGTLSEINVQTILKDRIGEEIQPYTILGVCNPNLASLAIKAEPEVGLLLPCNVLVAERDGSVCVSVLEPALIAKVSGNEDLSDIAMRAREKLALALDALP